MSDKKINQNKLSWWQSGEWWMKNWWTVILALCMITGALITFVGHTSDIAALEEETNSLKELAVNLNTQVIQFETTMKALIEDIGELKRSTERIEGILMNRTGVEQ